MKYNDTEYCHEAARSIVNGNLGYVLEQLDKLTRRQAMAAVARICNCLQAECFVGTDEGYLTRFRLALCNRV